MGFLANNYSFGSDIENIANNIAGGVSKAFLGSENTKRTLTDAAQKLLDSLDKTAQRTYINNGFANADRTKPNNRSIISQTPEMIVLIKKRMFSSLNDNYKVELMDVNEKHFMRAAKKLFENKCNDISNYEKLTKLNKLVQENQVLNTPIARLIYQTLNALDGNEYNLSADGPYAEPANSNKYTQAILENRNVIKRIRQLLTLNGFNQTTTWITDSNFEQKNSLGKGTGVIELTLVKNASFTVSLDFGAGGGSFTVVDPYRLFFIDEADIEKAIYQTANTKFNVLNTISDLLNQETDDLKQQLNNLRQSRGASSVAYKVDIRTRIYNRVTVILDRIGLEITKADGSGIDYDKVNTPNIPTFERFSDEEKELLDRIYNNIFKVLAGTIRDYEDFRKYNFDSNYVRKLMRQNFMGKQIIQPMDVVTCFIDSQTIDDKALSFEIKQSFLQQNAPFSSKVSNTLGSTNITGLISKTVGQLNQLTQLEAEKNILAGPDFPTWLYSALRPNFISQSFGTCVFSGLVKQVDENYNDGTYELSVECMDNANYFDQGWVGTKPSLDQFNGYLYDPVTPFDFDFDSATGLLPDISSFKLLPENVDYLKSNLFRFQDGKNVGQIITENKFMSPDVEPVEGLSKVTGTYSNISRKIFQAPDGFVYRWKRGIGTAIINQSGTSDGLLSTKAIHDDLALVQQEDPFGGQDLVNVVSILVCGEPYNFNTFIKSALGSDNVSSQLNFDPSTDYFQGLIKLIKKQNKVWGNFIPFKKLTIDPQTFSTSIALQLSASSKSASIRQKMDEKTRLLNKLMQVEGDGFAFDAREYTAPNNSVSLSSKFILTTNRTITFPLIKRIVELDAQIQLEEESIKTSINQSQINGTIAMIGSNLFYDLNNIKDKKAAKDLYKITLFKQNELTKRRIWQVKGNCDQNLFIVGSEYESDFDIQTLTKNLASDFDFINTSWQKITEKIKGATEVIGMEIFANSQGHIELRVPRYNRVPSSVLFEMLRKKKEYNIQVYPDFLEKTFSNKINATFEEIEILEDQIRLRAIALGAPHAGKDDADISKFLNGTLSSSNNEFIFVTDSNGTLSSIRNAVSQIDTDYSAAHKQQNNTFSVIPAQLGSDTSSFFKRKADIVAEFQQVTNTFNNFDIIKQNETLSTSYAQYNADRSNFLQTQSVQAQAIRIRLSKKLGVPLDGSSIKTIPQLLPNSKNGKLSPMDINALVKELDGLITQRYEAILSAVSLIKNLDAAARMNSSDDNIYGQLLMPNLYGSEDIPEFLRNMVEDELQDDYGFGSAKRFVLKESDIIRMSYKEDVPEYTSVEVSGAELGGLVGGQGGFEISGGAKLANVWATDYDLWRLYGHKGTSGKYLPFINNPETQLAPYAIFLLNQQRAKIFRADVTIRGNEYVQPGEVYYIQERGMLFYSKTVTHNFNYGESYTTSMTLGYGHVPGEYIPTPLDVIGKNVYNGHHLNIGNYRVARSGTTATEKSTHLNTLVFPNLAAQGMTTDLTPKQELYSDDLGEKNRQALADILSKVNLLLDTTIPQENRGMRAVVVRIYSNDTSGKDERLFRAARSVIDDLSNNGIPRFTIVGKDYKSNNLIPGDVMVVNFNENGNKRNPSNLAFTYAKDSRFAKNVDLAGVEFGNPLKDTVQAMIHTIIDVWIEYDIVPNDAIIKASTSKPAPSSAVGNSSGKNPGNTTKDQNLENMREFFKNLDANLGSIVKETK